MARKRRFRRQRKDGIIQRYWYNLNEFVRRRFPNQNFDFDSKKNKSDCVPLNPRWQDIISKKLKKDKEDVVDRRQYYEDPRSFPDFDKVVRNLEGDEEAAERDIEDRFRGQSGVAKEKAKNEMDDAVADLSREEISRELEEIGESAETEEEGRRILRRHWEDVIDLW